MSFPEQFERYNDNTTKVYLTLLAEGGHDVLTLRHCLDVLNTHIDPLSYSILDNMVRSVEIQTAEIELTKRRLCQDAERILTSLESPETHPLLDSPKDETMSNRIPVTHSKPLNSRQRRYVIENLKAALPFDAPIGAVERDTFEELMWAGLSLDEADWVAKTLFTINTHIQQGNELVVAVHDFINKCIEKYEKEDDIEDREEKEALIKDKLLNLHNMLDNIDEVRMADIERI